MKKRHEVLAAIAAAAGLTIASTAHAGLSANVYQPTIDSMVTLQTQVGENSDAALSKMIHLAKAGGEKSSGKSETSRSDKTGRSETSKSRGYESSGNPKASGGPLNPGKGNKHNPS